MSKTILDSVSTLTDRYQTTIPEPIRKALKLQKREQIRYEIQDDGVVTISKVEEPDVVMEKFLDFLSRDIEKHPEHLQPLTKSYVESINALTGDSDINLNKPLNQEDEA